MCVCFRYTGGTFLVNWAPKKIIATKYNVLGNKHFPAINFLKLYIKFFGGKMFTAKRVVFSGKGFFGAQFTRKLPLA